MDQNSLDFWNQHSVHFLEMAFGTDRRERLSQPDGYGRKGRECGDAIEIFLMKSDGRIRSASFETDGCLYSVACANAVVHLAEGRTAREAMEISPEMVMDYLETLPAAERHCAEMAVGALRLAVADLRRTEQQPWRKLYPRPSDSP